MASRTNSTLRVIENRKKAQATYDMMDSLISSEKKIMLIANFESSTTKKIDERNKKVTFVLNLLLCKIK